MRGNPGFNYDPSRRGYTRQIRPTDQRVRGLLSKLGCKPDTHPPRMNRWNLLLRLSCRLTIRHHLRAGGRKPANGENSIRNRHIGDLHASPSRQVHAMLGGLHCPISLAPPRWAVNQNFSPVSTPSKTHCSSMACA